MKIEGQNVTINQGNSFPLPFKLVSNEDDIVTHFDESDKIIFEIHYYGDHKRLIEQVVTGITGTEFDIFVPKEESEKLCCGKYKYSVHVENGHNRLTLLKDAEFNVV